MLTLQVLRGLGLCLLTLKLLWSREALGKGLWVQLPTVPFAFLSLVPSFPSQTL